MKSVKKAYETMQAIIEIRNQKSDVPDLTLGFYFTDEDLRCWVKFENGFGTLYRGKNSFLDAELISSFYDWLKLASGRLHPIKGIITGRLKFIGDSSLFKYLSPTILSKLPIEPQVISQKVHIPKDIIILNASPRKQRGYTDLLINSLESGLKSIPGKEVRRIYIEDYNIKPCTGCWSCWQRNNGDCIFDEKDDYKALSESIDQADLIVYAFPLYADGMPGKLKNYFDRHVSSLYPYMMNGANSICHPIRRSKRNQSLAILSICGFPEVSNFDPVIAHFKALAHNDHRVVVGELVRPAIMYLFNNPTLLDLQLDILDQLFQAGVQLASVGSITKALQKKISRPVCTKKQFIDSANQYWTVRILEKRGNDY